MVDSLQVQVPEKKKKHHQHKIITACGLYCLSLTQSKLYCVMMFYQNSVTLHV